jgi:predicted outer membrane protein
MRLRLLLALPFLVGGIAFAQTPQHEVRVRLLAQAAEADLSQIQLANLALSRSHDPTVRALARRTIEERTRDYQAKKLIADRDGLPFPSEPAGNAKALLEDLAALSGSAFDRVYLDVTREAQELHRRDQSQ